MKDKKELDYFYNFNHYHVLITYKRIRNIIYHYKIEKNLFEISAPYFASEKKIMKHLDEFAPKLIKKAEDKKPSLLNNQVYIFGKLYPIEISNVNQFNNNVIYLKNKIDLNKVLKKILLNYLNQKVRYYENLMNIKPYKISVRNMHTRFGSNSKRSHHLSFALNLVHYNYPVIDSVIIHELSHDKHFDHSASFYQLVYQYCPNYKNYKKALNKNRYDYEINQ